MQQISWILKNMKGYKWMFALGCFLCAFVALPMGIFPTLIISEFVDSAFTYGDMQRAYYLMGAYIIVNAIRIVIDYAQGMMLDIPAAKVLADFRTVLYEKLQKLGPSYYGQTRTGDIMMRLTGDLEMMRQFVCGTMPTALYTIVLLVLALIIFYSTNALLATFLLVVSPIMAILVMKMRKKASRNFTRMREMNSKLNTMVQESIAGNRVIKAFVREKYEFEKFKKCNEDYCDAAIDAADIWAKYAPIFTALSNGMLITMLVVGGIMVVYEYITIGDFLLFYSLNWMINSSVQMAGVTINDMQRFFSSTQKVMDLYNTRCDIANKDNPYIPQEKASAQVGKVEFENVSFKYDNRETLKKISLVAEAGETIGIMGPTGAGKSTLAMLMARFDDVSAGRIKIDGVDVRDYDIYTLRKKIGMSMQDVFLFSNTIDANVSYGVPDLDEDKTREYAKMADADGFIRRMPDGYATIVGERGVGLSGGQKQRIALARALAYESPILILDDTTSAVDMETEKYIQDQLAKRKGKHTTFIIAQRISSVKNADKIFIIENGEITESGTHKELLAKKGYYYDIYCIQQGLNGRKKEVSANV